MYDYSEQNNPATTVVKVAYTVLPFLPPDAPLDAIARAEMLLKRVCLSVCHVDVLCRNGLTYRQTYFIAW